MGGEDIGKNPVSEILIVRRWRETGFLRGYLMGCEDIGKNPVSEIVRADKTAQSSNFYTMLLLALIYLRFARSHLQSNQHQLRLFPVPNSTEFRQ